MRENAAVDWGKQRSAYTSARRGSHGPGGYKTWWRSGRDSNSRTGYARYGISSADSQIAAFWDLYAPQFQFDLNSISTPLELSLTEPCFWKCRSLWPGNAANARGLSPGPSPERSRDWNPVTSVGR